jgi:uncharacterized protein YyaL (SSP411 family)
MRSNNRLQRTVASVVPAFALLTGSCGCRGQNATRVSNGPAAAQFRYTNHLIDATSPYLLEHAHNPVDWYPWGAEALEKAKRENKPIFLSIGYSACHWCHVMERESFENEEIARILNANFVAIKVDREQRPDIDAQFMLAVQMMTNSGGWPLSVFLTPDHKPFYGGTYFPPEEFKARLLRIVEVWKRQESAVRDRGSQIAMVIARAATPPSGGQPAADAPARAIASLANTYDARHGGFGSRPKFPQAPELAFLLARYHSTGDKKLLGMATNTLDHMADGGIYDQLGGGFHRYSTDDAWRVPHFEKMLYDQALLVPLYLDAYRATYKPRYRQVVQETLAFVDRELHNPEGGFYSTLDADSEGAEGKYYLWTPAQTAHTLGGAAPLFNALYGVTPEGDVDGGSVLHLTMPLTEAARQHGMSVQALEQQAAGWRHALLADRNRRVRPHTDDKSLASWNGLMLAAYARAYQVLGDAEYRQTAIATADFLAAKMTREGKLFHSYRADKLDTPGLLEDYAFTAYGLLALYDATHDVRWLDRAAGIATQMRAQFADSTEGGFFTTAEQGDLLARMKEGEDNAIPSANGVAALVLARLAALRGDEWRSPAAGAIRAFGATIAQAPAAFSTLLIANQMLARPVVVSAPQIVTLQAGAVSRLPDGAYSIPLRLSVRSGWHINANHPSASYLKPTVLRLASPGAQLVGVRYPPPQRARFGYAKEPLDVYSGDAAIQATVRLPASSLHTGRQMRFVLAYQPCNDRACLAPAEIALEVTAPAP